VQFRELAAFNLDCLDFWHTEVRPSLLLLYEMFADSAESGATAGLRFERSRYLTGLTDLKHTEDRLQSCGRPSPGTDLRVVDAAGKPVASGELGNLVARGPGIMRGYWHDIEEELPGDESSVVKPLKRCVGVSFTPEI